MAHLNSVNISDNRLEVSLQGTVEHSELSNLSYKPFSGEDKFTLPESESDVVVSPIEIGEEENGGIFNYDEVVVEAHKANELEKVDDFLARLKEKSDHEGLPEKKILQQAFDLWKIWKADLMDTLSVPLVALGPEGSILFSKREQKYYIEMEINDKIIELFFEDKVTGEEELIDIEQGSVKSKLANHIHELFKNR